jgi:osmotically-inducible protein OsmY
MTSTTLPLIHRVDSALRKSPHLVGRNLILEAEDGLVILRGTVDNFYQKQMAQEAIRRVEGILQIQNRLEVHRS